MKLVDYRKMARKTQEELAILAKVSRETITRIETGRQIPTPAVAQRIAKALGMDIATMWQVLYQADREESA